MASMFKNSRREDNVVVLERLRNRLPEEREADLDELVGLAEYLVPLRITHDAVIDAVPEEIEAIIEWADADTETLRHAWMLAVHRCGTREVRRGAVELLATALHRAEERAALGDPRRRGPTAQPSVRPRVAPRTRQPLRRT
jgi:hypothetical protein